MSAGLRSLRGDGLARSQLRSLSPEERLWNEPVFHRRMSRECTWDLRGNEGDALTRRALHLISFYRAVPEQRWGCSRSGGRAGQSSAGALRTGSQSDVSPRLHGLPHPSPVSVRPQALHAGSRAGLLRRLPQPLGSLQNCAMSASSGIRPCWLETRPCREARGGY